MRSFLTTLLCFGFAISLQAQSFAPRILNFSKKKLSYITLNDGTELEGNFRKAKYKKGLMKEIVLEDTTTSEQQTIMAENVAAMRLVPSAWGKIAAASESNSSLAESAKRDDAMFALKRDYVYFETAQLSDKKNTFVLLQLVNPGFEGKIKVFDDPYAQETGGLGVGGVQMTGGFLKSYYFIQDGKAIKIKKGDYKDEFQNIFGDCPALEAKFKKVDWKDFPAHVFTHLQECD